MKTLKLFVVVCILPLRVYFHDYAVILLFYQWFMVLTIMSIIYRNRFWDNLSSNNMSHGDRPTLVFIIMHQVRGFPAQSHRSK